MAHYAMSFLFSSSTLTPSDARMNAIRVSGLMSVGCMLNEGLPMCTSEEASPPPCSLHLKEYGTFNESVTSGLAPPKRMATAGSR